MSNLTTDAGWVHPDLTDTWEQVVADVEAGGTIDRQGLVNMLDSMWTTACQAREAMAGDPNAVSLDIWCWLDQEDTLNGQPYVALIRVPKGGLSHRVLGIAPMMR